MKDFSELPTGIQVMVEGYAMNDPYGLQPSTLYKNILGSLMSYGDNPNFDKVAEIFAVSSSLCEMIYNENKPQWSISEKQFKNCTDSYKEVQEDIVEELKSIGDNVEVLKTWVNENNADFVVVM